MPNNKSPGMDGFPAEFYKHFWPTISPLFVKMVNEIKRTSSIPSQMNTALISVLLKPNKDSTLCSSYRPISLINTDLKIISKALSTKLEKVISNLIHPDQTGFIKGRQSSHNTRRLINLINFTKNSNRKTIILSLDAEKAFDKVNWDFLFSTLHKFGFGTSFIHWIQILYSSPMASVITNDITSSSFTLSRGTRQGCPLSPLLFTIFIEPLATAIRQNDKITGILTHSIAHKISLYADDVLLFLQDPTSSIKETIKLINSFSHVSDYSVNWNKSTALPIDDWN